MRCLEELQITDAWGGESSQAAPTPELLARVEAEIGSRLPTGYVELLMFHNGGYPTLNTFIDEFGEPWVVDRFFEITPDAGNPYHVLWEYRQLGGEVPPTFVPIAQDAGGNLFCLDLAKRAAPVSLWFHDAVGEPIRYLASAFTDFIDGLIAFDKLSEQPKEE